MQEHPVVEDCNTTLCDAWGVPADNLPTPAAEDPTVASMFDLRVYPPIDVVLKQIFDDAGTARLGGVSSGRGWSSFSTFQRCPYLWYRKYILQRRGFSLSESPALAVGTLVHVFLAVHYQAMIQEDYPLTPDQVYELSRRAGNPEFVEEAWRVFSAYRIYYSLETIQPLAVEYDLRDPRTGESCRYDLIMYMPEAVNGYSAGTYIVESKTASRFDRETLEGWPNDGEVLGQVALWKQLGLDRRFGELKGVMMNICGKQKKQPQFQRILVSPNSWQIEEHLKDLKRWEGLINLAQSNGCFPRARAACVGRYGFCENYDHCNSGVEG